jgi:LDH2 family malate/lactate/ureidoglycolate dehydrogenase
VLFDVATSAIAGNKIRLAMRVGAPLLPGWVSDKEGRLLTEDTLVHDRSKFLQLPLGGTREQVSHKGYGLALMAEILSTLLSGAVPSMLDPSSGSKTHFAAYKIDAFTDVEQYYSTIDGMLEALRTAPPAPGHDRVLYPGLSEHEEVLERRAHGIPLHQEVIEWFGSVTRELGLPGLDTM